MKKLAALSSGIIYLYYVTSAFAQQITIEKPSVGYSDIGTFINRAITLAFIIAVVAVLVMLVWGAIQWIFSGGDKEAVAGARNRIIHALVGFAILAVAFAIAVLAGNFLGFNILGTFTIPSPNNPGVLPVNR